MATEWPEVVPASPFPFEIDDDDGAQQERLEKVPDVARIDVPDAHVQSRNGRTLRARSEPAKYGEGHDAPFKDRFARFPKAERKALREQWRMNQTMRQSMNQTTRMLREGALQHQCPLLVQKAKECGDYDPRSLKGLVRTRMKCVARAGDGRYYDKKALIAYVKANMEKRLVSPVTGESMTALVLFAEPHKGKPDEWKTSKWMPTFAPLAFSDGDDAEAAAED